MNQQDQKPQGNTQGNQNMRECEEKKNEQSNQQECKPQINPLYQRVSETDAQACAWVFESPEKMDRYFYRHPPLSNKDVRIRVLFSAICQTDVEKGRSKCEKICYPFCGGHETVGEVIALGKDVSRVKIGDKVLLGPIRDACMNCEMCKLGETPLCTNLQREDKQNINGKYFGGFSTHLQQPESHIFKLPDGLNIEAVAPLMCAGLTVYRPLAKYGRKLMTVGMIGIGGLGHLAIQFARAMGMQVDAFINKKSMHKYHDILNLGVNKIVEWDDDRCMKLCQNQYDMLLYMLPVSLPADEMNKIMHTLKPMGKFILIGVPPQEQKFEVSFMPIVLKDIQIIGSLCGGQQDTEAMLKYAKSNHIESQCEFFEFDDFPKAIEHVEKGQAKFRVVLRVDQVSRRFKQ